MVANGPGPAKRLLSLRWFADSSGGLFVAVLDCEKMQKTLGWQAATPAGWPHVSEDKQLGLWLSSNPVKKVSELEVAKVRHA